MKTEERVRAIVRTLKRRYTHTFYATLDPFPVLITTVLSQRTMDIVTFPVANILLKRYPTAAELAKAKRSDVERIIRPIGFYRQKASRIIRIAQDILVRFKGRVPDDAGRLLTLDGVGRKTANCVLAYSFGKAAIAVDTHVHRISNRLGLVDTATPLETERALERIVPEALKKDINWLLVRHGQETCRPIGPRCDVCPIISWCERCDLPRGFTCKGCDYCCRMVPILDAADIRRIEAAGKRRADFVRTESEGRTVMRMQDGRCVFLKEGDNNLCSIYENRPRLCRLYPFRKKDIDDCMKKRFSQKRLARLEREGKLSMTRLLFRG
ncbi:YkgJ family cysteine cluster protein [Candidatus Woesearchaeota archaeon]|nr:YkgJ family cysteine cluster protein [Candidatus Woesearchaeota archaeon]